MELVKKPNINWIRKPSNRVKTAVILFWLAAIAWPITSFSVFKSEPQGILALSWLAILLTALDIIVTTDLGND